MEAKHSDHRHQDGFLDKRKEIKMFIRAIIFTAFNGFEKVTTTDKRRLAKVLNTLSKDINSEAKATIKSLDHVYRSEIFNTESPESMQRLANLRADLKKVAADGINIRMNVIDEKTFVEPAAFGRL